MPKIPAQREGWCLAKSWSVCSGVFSPGDLIGLSQTPTPGTKGVTQVMSRIRIKPEAAGIGSW